MIVIVIKGKGVLYCKEYKIVFDYLSNSALLVQAILFVCFQPWLYFPSVILSSAFQIHFLPPNPPSFLFDLLSILLPPLTHQWQCIALWVVLPDLCSFPCTVMPCLWCIAIAISISNVFFFRYIFVVFFSWGSEGFFKYWYCLSFVLLMFLSFFFMTLEISSQKRNEIETQCAFLCHKEDCSYFFNIIITRHLNKRRVIILCCFLKYHCNRFLIMTAIHVDVGPVFR